VFYFSHSAFSQFLGHSISTFLLIPETELGEISSQHDFARVTSTTSQQTSFNLREEENGHIISMPKPATIDGIYNRKQWLLVIPGPSEKPEVNANALHYVCLHSPLFWILEPLFRSSTVKAVINLFFGLLHELWFDPDLFTSTLMLKETKRFQQHYRRPGNKHHSFLSLCKSVLLNGLLLWMFISMMIWNLSTTEMISTSAIISKTIDGLFLQQNWRMFSPNPPSEYWHHVIHGTLSSTKKVELFKV
jgi:hypothetical protein